SLPEDDLLYLRMDITKLNVVAHWAQNLKEGRTVSVLAEVGNEIAGYVSLHHNEVTWQRHLGEVRLQVGPRYRSQGLGRALAGAMMGEARIENLAAFAVALGEEALGPTGTLIKLRDALDRDRVTKRFSDHFKREHTAFLKFVTGITGQIDKEWYASLLLNRLM